LTILSHNVIIDANSGQANSFRDMNAKQSPMSFAQQVRGLTESAINDISLHYDSAVDTEHGSGDHWILMAVFGQVWISHQQSDEGR
jgi:hypothetical protein